MKKTDTSEKRVKKVTFQNVLPERSNIKFQKYTTPIITLIISVIVFRLYIFLTHIPERPDLDEDLWWGPNTTKGVQDTSVRPYRIVFPESAEYELRKKFELYRSGHKVESFNDTSHSYGLNSHFLSDLFDFWRFKYNIREREKYFNRYEHFLTNIDGLDLHFVRVKPQVKKHVKILPILLLHGFPGSFKEFYEVIPQLTTERDEYDFLFEVIVPSLPGFGYSQSPRRPGLSPLKMAVMMHKLMQRIGLEQYYVQGGDFGYLVGSYLATLYPKNILGFHTNTAFNFNLNGYLIWFLGALLPGLVENQYEHKMYPLSDKLSFILEESGYIHMQATKPDTLGVSLQDSPLGLAAYIIEKYISLSEPNPTLTDSLKDYSMVDLLDNVMVYWFSNTAMTSMRVYAEIFNDLEAMDAWNRIPTSVPTWGLHAKNGVLYQPDYVLKWKYTKYFGSTHIQTGGHYIALQSPEILADDVFKAIRKFDGYHLKLLKINK